VARHFLQRISMDKISAEQMGEAVIKLMRLAQTALDAGRIADASRLLRLAAAASENHALIQKIRDSSDATLAGMAADEGLPKDK
jgi:hypothetical protein